MKYLSDYTRDAQSALFIETGALFVKSKADFEARRQQGVDYCDVGITFLVVPTANAKALLDGLERVTKEGRAADLAENGKDGVIRRELFNHEAFYDGVYSRCFEVLAPYGISEDEIVAAYRHILNTEQFD